MTADTPTAQDAAVTEPHRGAILGMALLVAAAMVLAAQALPGPARAQQPAAPSASQADGACPEGTPSAGFPDVAGTTHERTIDCVSWYGIARGTLPGAYSPAQSVRRDQLASFAARLLEAAGVALPAARDQGFGDLAGNTHADAINQLAELGIVQGTSATTYRPAHPVRRDQMASFLVRAYEHLHGEPLDAPPGAFTDTAGNTHAAAIDAAAAAGFTHGTTATTYSPALPVRRDQMASFLARALDRGVDDGHVDARPLPAPTLTNDVPLHVRGVGRAVVGMTLAEVEQLTGTPVEIAEFATFDGFCYYADPQGVSGYSFMVVAPGEQPPADPRQGIVARVSSTLFDEPHTPTTAGVRPGDPRAAVIAAYGAHQVVQHPHVYQPEGVYLDIVAADGAHGLRFEVNGNDEVEFIHVGDANAVTWPEGCA